MGEGKGKENWMEYMKKRKERGKGRDKWERGKRKGK